MTHEQFEHTISVRHASKVKAEEWRGQVPIPMKAVTDSDLMPGSGSDVMAVAIGAKLAGG